MRIHPFADKFPMLSEKELGELAEDIKANKQEFPIIVWEGHAQVVDGRNRLRACEIADIKPWTEYRPFKDEAEVARYIVSANLKRRHLNESQRAMLGADLEEVYAEEAKKRQGTRTDIRANLPECEEPARAREEAARDVNVSPRLVQTAKTVKEKGAPELKEAVMSGEIAVSAAATLAQAPKEEQVAALRGGKEEVKKKNKEIKEEKAAAKKEPKPAPRKEEKPAKKNGPIVQQADALAFLRTVAPGSVDLLLTDPPEATETEDQAAFVRAWLPLALSRLKETGLAFVFVSPDPEELLTYLSLLSEEKGFSVANIMPWVYQPTSERRDRCSYQDNWKPILHIRGKSAADLILSTDGEISSVQNFPAPDSLWEHSAAGWQKPDAVADRLIRNATRQGQTVLDPFAGTGTFLLSAAKLKRVPIGCENNPEILKLAERRGCRCDRGEKNDEAI